MSEVFASLHTVHARGRRLAIPDADVIAGYIGSLQSLPELGQLPGSDVISDLVEAARLQAQATIDREGIFEVHTHAGVFVARRGRSCGA